jgi:C_GCAxxG_C_C family probable redox protein
MTKREKAIDYFRNDFNCSQAVLSVFSPDFNLSEEASLKIACAFGAGMGRQQHTCGAVTGALMVIGLKYGKARGDSNDKKLNTYRKTLEFLKAFETENGSINCKKLLQGLDMSDPADMKKIKDLGLFDKSCEKYVADAVNMTEKIIAQE